MFVDRRDMYPKEFRPIAAGADGYGHLNTSVHNENFCLSISDDGSEIGPPTRQVWPNTYCFVLNLCGVRLGLKTLQLHEH